MQWSFSKCSGSSSPQILSFQEEKTPKSGFESLKSSGLVSITTKEVFDYVQKNIVPKKQGGAHYSASTYPAKHMAKHTIHRSVTSPSSTSITVSPTVKPSYVGQNRIGFDSSQNHHGAIQQTNYVPSSSPLVRSTELRNGGANISSPDLLTVFYNGSVCVFDNVSLEKAQAIMLLARNSPPTTCSPSPPVAPAQASVHRSPINLDGFALSQPYNSACLSPLPIKSISLSQPACRSSNNSRDTIIVPPVGILESSFSKAEPLRAVYPPRYLPSTSTSGTVPQFRRKSLARFLEKRKDRVVSTSPYAEKQS